jgi:hypothetical protein
MFSALVSASPIAEPLKELSNFMAQSSASPLGPTAEGRGLMQDCPLFAYT